MAFPKVISAAATRARDTRVIEFAELSRSERALLAYIIEHLSVKDFKKKVTHDLNYVSSRLDVCRRTLSSAAKRLKTLGILQENEQPRRHGRFHCSGFQLSQKAIKILFSPCAKSTPDINNSNHITVIVNIDKKATTRHGKYVLPKYFDKWVKDGIFKPIDVIRLLRESKSRNIHLQHVLNYCGPDLLARKESPVAYVLSLLKLDKDWRLTSKRADNKNKKMEEKKIAQQQEKFLERLARQSKKITWIEQNGDKIVLTPDLFLKITINGDTKYGRLNDGWAKKLINRRYSIEEK